MARVAKKTKVLHKKAITHINNFNLFKLLSVSGIVIGVFVGVLLIKNMREIENMAAVPEGIAKVYLEPAAGDMGVGQSVTLKELFEIPQNVAISGVATRIIYPYSGLTPEVAVENVTIDSNLTSSGDWTCPTQVSSTQGGSVVVDIACANTSANGFTGAGKTAFATIKLTAKRVPAINPVVVRFDPALSVITLKSTSQDILLIPVSTATIKIGNTVTPSPKISPQVSVSISPLLTNTETCSLTLYPPEVVIRENENISFAAFNSGKLIDQVRFSTDNRQAIELSPGADTQKPFLMNTKAHKVSEVTSGTITAEGYTRGQKICEAQANVKILP